MKFRIPTLNIAAYVLSSFVITACSGDKSTLQIDEKLRVQVEEILRAAPSDPSTRAEVNLQISSDGEIKLSETRFSPVEDVIKLQSRKHIVICRDTVVGTFVMVTDDPWGAMKVCGALDSRSVSIF